MTASQDTPVPSVRLRPRSQLRTAPMSVRLAANSAWLSSTVSSPRAHPSASPERLRIREIPFQHLADQLIHGDASSVCNRV